MAKQYNELKERITALKLVMSVPPAKCSLRKLISRKYETILLPNVTVLVNLKGVVARGKEIAELDKKAKAQFEQWKADDIAKVYCRT